MAILGLQGVRGGTGVTSITAALAWALQLLGETVLAIDASPDNMLRFFFNTDVHAGSSSVPGGCWRTGAPRAGRGEPSWYAARRCIRAPTTARGSRR